MSDQRFHKKGDPNQWTYMVMNHAKDGEGSIYNSRMCTTIQINNSPSYPEFTIGIKLAKAMGCVKMGTMEHGEVGYILSPKLRKEFPNNTLPAAVDVVQPKNNEEEINPDVLNLSTFINWVFTDLDGAYQKAFGNNRRPLYLYSNAMRSMVVGNQVTDLMERSLTRWRRDTLHPTRRNICWCVVMCWTLLRCKWLRTTGH